MDVFHKTIIGYSHILENKACQDFSLSYKDDTMSVAIVSDGHGGEPYFRSNRGSKIACECALNMICKFVSNVEDSIFKEKPFTQASFLNLSANGIKMSETDLAMRQLLSSIIYHWGIRIEEDYKNSEITQWERENVPDETLQAFKESKTPEKAYGCTLMCYVQTKSYWFAFHIGDGKCVSLHESDPIWKEPIPWDDKCFLNKTTSLCETDSLNSFRYCYCGDGNVPLAVFLGSDGIDDTFGEGDSLAEFYIKLSKELICESKEYLLSDLERALPELSQKGSKDDMSIACVYDPIRLKDSIKRLIQYQIDLVTKKQLDNKSKLESLKSEEIELAANMQNLTEDMAICRRQIKKLEESNSLLETEYQKLIKELES